MDNNKYNDNKNQFKSKAEIEYNININLPGAMSYALDDTYSNLENLYKFKLPEKAVEIYTTHVDNNYILVKAIVNLRKVDFKVDCNVSNFDLTSFEALYNLNKKCIIPITNKNQGRTSDITIDNNSIRYNSIIFDPAGLPVSITPFVVSKLDGKIIKSAKFNPSL